MLWGCGGACDEFWQLACFSNFKTSPLQGYYLPWYALEIIVTDQIRLCSKGCLSLHPFKYCMFPFTAAPLDTSLSSCKCCCSLFFQLFSPFSLSLSASILQAVPLWSCVSAVWNLRLKSICLCPSPINTYRDINKKRKKGVVVFNRSKSAILLLPYASYVSTFSLTWRNFYLFIRCEHKHTASATSKFLFLMTPCRFWLKCSQLGAEFY